VFTIGSTCLETSNQDTYITTCHSAVLQEYDMIFLGSCFLNSFILTVYLVNNT